MKYDKNIMPSFNFYKSWAGIFRALKWQDSRTLLEWMFWYVFEECEPTEEQLENSSYGLVGAWGTIRRDLDKQLEKWRDYVENNV